MKTPAFKALVSDYLQVLARQELAGMWAVVVFFRLPGFAVARIAIALGIPATCLTLLGLISTILIALAAVLLPVSAALWCILVFAVIFQIIDCADGTVARATGTTSLRGRFLDFASDILWRATCLAALGHVADRMSPDTTPSWMAVGLVAGFCATYARLMRCYVDAFAPDDAQAGNLPRYRPTLGNLTFSFLSGLDQIIPVIAVAAWTFGWLDVVLIGTVIYHGADVLLAGKAAYGTFAARDRRRIETGDTP